MSNQERNIETKQDFKVLVPIEGYPGLYTYGDIELPDEGTELIQNEPYGTLESVKAVSDLISALSGTIEEVNKEIQSNPELLNTDPFGKGWLILLKPLKLEEEKRNLMNFDKAVKWHKTQG